jgi:hypothetical protein
LVPRVLCIAMMIAICTRSRAAAPKLEPVADLKDAAPNTWTRIVHSPTGWRNQPIFVYAGGIKRFIMAAGIQANGGLVARHYDTEEFDLPRCKWFNAYPSGVAAGRPESGPVGEDYAKARIMLGNMGFEMFYHDGDYLRVAAGGQWTENRAGYEYCYVPDDGKIYCYLHDHTLRYDPARRTFEDTNAKPRTSCRIWGAMCYDPVNKEIIHAGGDGGNSEIGTWVYSIEKNQWRKLQFGSPGFNALHMQATDLLWQGKMLLGAACNRFAITEAESEAKADLRVRALDLAKAIAKLGDSAGSAHLNENERMAGKIGSLHCAAASASFSALAEELAAPITPATIAKLRGAREMLMHLVDAFSAEPPGRARSQIAYDSVHKKIVMFGGDALDRVLSDTWLYDCQPRTWEQKFPQVCPMPRAGHILAALPKSKEIVMAGGYSREPLPQEIWTYDIDQNQWKMLLNMPLGKPDSEGYSFSHNAPRTTRRLTQTGAVNEDDVLVCVTSAEPTLITWACKIDPEKTIEVPKGQSGSAGLYTWNAISPQTWEALARPDKARAEKFYTDLPPNQWTALTFPKYAPGAANRWGTTAYDTDRHQFLFWGGGHATSKENDVAHFSVLGSCWTIGYHPDDPIETVYASQPTPLSFSNRPQLPVHAYNTTAGEMFYFDRAYNLQAREWEPTPLPDLLHQDVMHAQLRSTPKGAVAFSSKGLFRFDASQSKWIKLPWTGPKPESIWCDGEGYCYDSKRDCLWFGMKKEIYRYDLASGKAERVTFQKPKALGEFTFWGEQVYLPDADLILLMKLFKRLDGQQSNVAFDPQTGKFLWLDLKFVKDGTEVELKDSPFSWSDALAYDPELKLVLLNNSSAFKVWAMKFDPKTVKRSEMVD